MTDNITTIRRRNLVSWMSERGLSQSDMSHRLDVSRSYLSLLLRSNKPFGEKAARSIEQKLMMRPLILDEPELRKTGTISEWVRPQDLPPDDYALVPRVSIRLSAGSHELQQTEHALPPLAFRAEWLRKKGVSGKANLRTVDVYGDSMEDYLQDGDIVLIDLGQTDIIDGEVYAIRYGDDLRVKRLFKRHDGGIIIRSDNPKHGQESLSQGEASHIAVIGRMLWRGG